jgi:hypothetical protein
VHWAGYRVDLESQRRACASCRGQGRSACPASPLRLSTAVVGCHREGRRWPWDLGAAAQGQEAVGSSDAVVVVVGSRAVEADAEGEGVAASAQVGHASDSGEPSAVEEAPWRMGSEAGRGDTAVAACSLADWREGGAGS